MGKAATTKSSEKEAKVSFMDRFEFVDATRKGKAKTPDTIEGWRATVITAIRIQMENVRKEIAGERLTDTKFKNKHGTEITREATRWYSIVGNVAKSEIRYGQKSIFLNDAGKPRAIKAGKTIEDLIPFYEKIIEAVQDKELDDQITKARDGLRGGPAPATPSAIAEAVKEEVEAAG